MHGLVGHTDSNETAGLRKSRPGESWLNTRELRSLTFSVDLYEAIDKGRRRGFTRGEDCGGRQPIESTFCDLNLVWIAETASGRSSLSLLPTYRDILISFDLFYALMQLVALVFVVAAMRLMELIKVELIKLWMISISR